MSTETIASMINSQGEKIEIAIANSGEFKGQKVLKLHDDFPSLVIAYHLLDDKTVEFLLKELSNER